MEISEEYLRLIHRHLSGTATNAEKDTLADWLEASQSNREYYATMAALFHASSALDNGERTDRMLARLNARIDSEKEGKARLFSRAAWISAASVAAAFVIGIGTYLFFQADRTEARTYASDPHEFTAYSNVSDDVSAIMLDDSTKVWLATNSSVLCSTHGSERVVKLSGEAYFDVHRDTLRPFVVKTGDINVKVLGTAFCVNADEASGKVSVLLERGSVRLQSPEGVGLVKLSPDQMAEYDAKTGDIEVTSMDATPYIVQRYNKVALQQVSISGIISHIERMYGVKVQAESPVDTTRKYNLNYKRTDDVQELVEAVQELTGVSLRIQDNK